MYIKKYRSSFNDIDNNSFDVEFYIYDEKEIAEEWIYLGDDEWINTKTGEIYHGTTPPPIPDTSTVLKHEGTPIDINYEMGSESFKAVRYSGTSLKFLFTQPVFELYQGEITRVMVKIKKNGNDYWSGFVTPCAYNQPYTLDVDEFTLETIDRLSALQYFKYKGSTDIKSTYGYLKDIISNVNLDGYIKNIYVQKKLQINGSYDILNTLYLQGKNFYDEEDEGLQCDQIIEYLMTYLGMTMIQWGNDIYMLDMKDLYDNDTMNFNVYNFSSSVASAVTLNFPTYTLNGDTNKLECGEDTCDIELDEVYNKVTVVGNLLEYSDMIDDISSEKYGKYLAKYINNVDGDLSSLKILKVDDKYPEDKSKIQIENEYIVYNAFYYLSGASMNAINFSNMPLPPNGVTFEKTKRVEDKSNRLTGGTFYQVSYKELVSGTGAESNPKITTSITYVNDIDKGLVDGHHHAIYQEPYITRNRTIEFFNKTPSFYNDGNYFIIDFNYKLSNQPNYEYANHFYDLESGSTTSTAYFNNTEVNCYKDESTKNPHDVSQLVVINCLLKVGDYYYKRTYGDEYINYTSWIHYWDEHDYYEKKMTIRDFPYKEEWTKEYSTFEVLTIVGSGESFNNLSLTNEVSYTFNKASESGALIKLPNFTLDGDIDFAINDVLNLHIATITDAGDESTKGNRLDGPFPHPVVDNRGYYHFKYTDGLWESIPLWNVYFNSFHLESISMKYVKPDTSHKDFVYDEEDVRYTNIINEQFVKEASDITLYINTYDFKHNSYSYALLKDGDNYKYVREIFDGTDNKIQEHRIIERFVNHYSKPKVKYSNTFINNGNITPFTKIHIKTLNKDFLALDLNYQLRLNKVNIKTSEY